MSTRSAAVLPWKLTEDGGYEPPKCILVPRIKRKFGVSERLFYSRGDFARNTRLQMRAAFKENLLDHMATLDPNTEISVHPLTKVICCIGPTKSSVQDIEVLLESGMTTALLPMWAYNQDEKIQAIRNIREAVNVYSMKHDRVIPLGVGLDLRGPLTHTGRLHNNQPVMILEGTVLTLTTRPNWEEHGNATKVFIDSVDLPKQVAPGIDILIDSGRIIVNVGHVLGEEDIVCNVIKGGKLFNNRMVNTPALSVLTKELTQVDIEDIEFGITMGVDFLCVSCVQFDCVLKEIRKILDFRKSGLLIMAKIENKVGFNNLDEIVKEADAISLVRQSLSIEISEERLFLVQDNVTAICKMAGKPLYVEGLILKTTAVDDDVSFEGIIDVMGVVTLCQKGVDGILMRDTLSYGLNQKNVMDRLLNICVLAEPSYWHSHFFNKLSTMASPPIDPTHAIAIAVVEAAMKSGAAAILVCTASGASAKLICRYLPRVPVIAITRYGRVARQLSLYKAAVPFHYVAPAMKDWLKDVDLRFQAGIGLGKEIGFIKPGDALVLLSGWRPGAGFTNTMRMTYASQTDPWIHLRDAGLDTQAEASLCSPDEDCTQPLY